MKLHLELTKPEIEELLAVLDNQSDENDWFLDEEDLTRVYTWQGDLQVFEDLSEHIHRMLHHQNVAG